MRKSPPVSYQGNGALVMTSQQEEEKLLPISTLSVLFLRSALLG